MARARTTDHPRQRSTRNLELSTRRQGIESRDLGPGLISDACLDGATGDGCTSYTSIEPPMLMIGCSPSRVRISS